MGSTKVNPVPEETIMLIVRTWLPGLVSASEIPDDASHPNDHGFHFSAKLEKLGTGSGVSLSIVEIRIV